MTRAALLLAAGCAAALAGCAAATRPTVPRPTTSMPTASGFDAAAWLARATAAEIQTVETDPTTPSENAYRARLAAQQRLAAELDPATGWMRACDTYWDPETEREVYDPAGPYGRYEQRGYYDLYAIAPGEAVVAVTCSFAAYQGAYVLVHIEGPRATLLESVVIDLEGRPFGPPSVVFSTPGFEDGSRLFETFAKGRGFADCGLLSRYRLGAGLEATLVEARGRACEGPPDDAPPIDEWPVIFPR